MMPTTTALSASAALAVVLAIVAAQAWGIVTLGHWPSLLGSPLRSFPQSVGSSLTCKQRMWTPPASYGQESGSRLIPVEQCLARRVLLTTSTTAGLSMRVFAAGHTIDPRIQRIIPVHMAPQADIQVVRKASDDWASARPMCDEYVEAPTILFGVPDLSNLYHTLFDLLVPLWDTITENRSKRTIDTKFLVVNSATLTGAQVRMSDKDIIYFRDTHGMLREWFLLLH